MRVTDRRVRTARVWSRSDLATPFVSGQCKGNRSQGRLPVAALLAGAAPRLARVWNSSGRDVGTFQLNNSMKKPSLARVVDPWQL